MRNVAYIGAGSNVGDRLAWLQFGVDQLNAHEEIVVEVVSPVYESEAHTLDGVPQTAYLNAVYEISTSLTLSDLAAILMETQAAAGGDVSGDVERWQPRTLDLDLLLFGKEQVDGEEWVVPHPRMSGRRFVLAPLADLSPFLVIPGLGRTVADLLDECPDRHACERIPDILRR